MADFRPWPSARWRRLCTSHLKPWRMDQDGFYVRRVSLAALHRLRDHLISAAEQERCFLFNEGRLLFARDETAVLNANRIIGGRLERLL